MTIPWENSVMVDSYEVYRHVDGTRIVGRFRTFAETTEDAKNVAQVFFRTMLTQAGIDWRGAEEEPLS